MSRQGPNLIRTGLQAGVLNRVADQPFQRLSAVVATIEAVETASTGRFRMITGLKPGAKEMRP